MEIKHHIVFNDHHIDSLIRGMGIEIKNGLISTFDISENDYRWPDLQKFINKHPGEIKDLQLGTRFTPIEMKSANYFALSPNWHFEYPQPENDFEYLMTTYNSAERCQKCGIGSFQIKPFYLRNAPKWGKRNIGQVNWVFDEYFISNELKTIFDKEKCDLTCKSVFNYKTNMVFDDIFQLDIIKTIELDMGDVLTYQSCDMCKNIKYFPHTRGFFPKPLQYDFDIAHSKQYFGDGFRAFHAVLINRRIYNLFNEIGVKGISYIPCIL
jgi:hypothetical protein